jgi:hypothetical protein
MATNTATGAADPARAMTAPTYQPFQPNLW